MALFYMPSANIEVINVKIKINIRFQILRHDFRYDSMYTFFDIECFII